MRNKNVGMLIIGIAVVLGIIVFLFNNALKTITSFSCSMGTTCPMYSAINVQTYVASALILIIVIIGIVIMLSREEKQIVTKMIREKAGKKEINLNGLDSEEKKLIQIINGNQGTIFQSELTEKSGFDKVKVSRILDRLEGKQIIERRRRGMTNIVILKN
jgi:uncharacterized membrane protein